MTAFHDPMFPPPADRSAGHDGGRYGEAVFRPEQAGEGERIDFGALAYDDVTMARLRALGAGPGWHCLDVGAGTGTVSRRLLDEAGVTSVLAVDRTYASSARGPYPGWRYGRPTSPPRTSPPADSGSSTRGSC